MTTGGLAGAAPGDLGERLIALLPRLRRFAIALSRSRDSADDLVQAACERALGAPESSAAGMNLDAWMFRILRNLWIDDRRRRRIRGIEVELDTADAVLTAEPDVERRLVLRRVAAAIDTLPDDQRVLLLLVCVEDVSYRDAAQVLDMPIGTVMSRLARARRRVAEATGLSSVDL